MRNYSYTVLFFLIMAAIGCTDLEEEPKADILAPGFFVSLSSLESSVGGVYKRIINYSNPWETAMSSTRFRAAFCAADDYTSKAGSNKANWVDADVFAFQNTPLSGNMGVNNWNMPWAGILQANWVIESGGEYVASLTGDDAVAGRAILAEARVWRAWCYFYLVRMFGPVPIIETTDYDPDIDLNVQSEQVASVYNFIERDLRYAADHGWESVPNDKQSRITREAAQAFMAEFALTRAGWPLKQTNYYDTALLYADAVINSGKYALYPDFYELFDQLHEDNSEYIWQLNFCIEGCAGNGGSVFSQKGSKAAPFGGFEDLFLEKTFANSFPAGPRKMRSVVSTYLAEVSGDTVRLTFSVDHAFMSKFWGDSYDSTALAATLPQDSFSPIDWPMIRLAEVYLIAAEAQAMSSGAPNAQSYAYVNMIRRRGAGLDLNTPDARVDLPTGLSAVDFQDEILAERGWELLGEMQRWFDLTRLEKVAEVTARRDPSELELINPPPVPGSGLEIRDPYYYLKPIDDIVLNPNIETVNPEVLTFN